MIIKKYDDVATIKNINHLVLDCDDCIALISPKWFNEIYKNKDHFEKFFDFSFIENFNLETDFIKVLYRNEFYLNKWLLRDDIDIDNKEFEEITNDMISLYDTKDFYDDLFKCKIGIAFSNLSMQKFITKVTILTRSTQNNQNSKNRFLYRNFINSFNKVEIIHIKNEEKKSDIVKDLKNVSIILDDELGNIEDYIKNCNNLENTEILIPKYGYNIVDDKLLDLSLEKNINLNYINAF